MSKGANSISDIFVQKLSHKVGKLITREEIADIWTLSGGSKSRVAYGLGQAKNRGLISPLGGGIFIIGEVFDDTGELYWQKILLLIRRYSPSGGIIAHEKSMEYHLRNLEIPSRLVIYTRDTDKRILLGEQEVHFRTLKTGEKTGTKNMYRILLESSIEGSIEGVKLRFLGLESCLLDVASLRIHENGIAEPLILRFLSKYSVKLSRIKLGELVTYRYIRAINRIRSLAKAHGYDSLYTDCLDIIKKEGGGCYLNL